MMNQATRTQLRATCPACFAQQAVRGGSLADHGYKRPQQWHSNVGNCAGAGKQHFGTEAGRDYTARIAASLRKQAAETAERSAAILAGTEPVMMSKRVAVGVSMQVIKENATDSDRASYAAFILRTGEMMLQNAAELEAKVAAWTAVEPVEFTVEVKGPAAIHYRTKARWNGYGKACAASAMGAQRSAGGTTSDRAIVTCPKCLNLIARLDAVAAKNQVTA